ncbi:type II toxin-antitoxin system RatA family toxin [Acidocella sp.]|uniref:type II toxin-antitoxin system RatA family toxin n=1 Tax=Acidocella sp. TaxID=50710 RepID=UPI003CFC4BD8
MTKYAQQKLVPYSAQQLYALVADVGKYPKFLPWCVGARVRSHVNNLMIADLTIGFGPFRESFTSRVTLLPGDGQGPCAIRVEYEKGPFKYLHNRWDFAPRGQGSQVDFFVDFEFRNVILQKAIGAVFTEAVHLMVNAFLKRAAAVYGDPTATRASGASSLSAAQTE